MFVHYQVSGNILADFLHRKFLPEKPKMYIGSVKAPIPNLWEWGPLPAPGISKGLEPVTKINKPVGESSNTNSRQLLAEKIAAFQEKLADAERIGHLSQQFTTKLHTVKNIILEAYEYYSTMEDLDKAAELELVENIELLIQNQLDQIDQEVGYNSDLSLFFPPELWTSREGNEEEGEAMETDQAEEPSVNIPTPVAAGVTLSIPIGQTDNMSPGPSFGRTLKRKADSPSQILPVVGAFRSDEEEVEVLGLGTSDKEPGATSKNEEPPSKKKKFKKRVQSPEEDRGREYA